MKTRPRLSRCTNMAAGERAKVTIVACILCLLFAQTASENGKVFPTKDKVKLWATAFNNKLVPMLNGLSGFYAIDVAFNKDNATLKGVQFRDVEPQKLVEQMAHTLSKMLSKKMDALRQLVDVAEKAAKNYTFIGQLQKEQVHYYNSKTMKRSENENEDPVLMDSVRFKQKINTSFSSVHIPVEIYDGDTEILNGLKWTEALDKQFKLNYEKDQEILWQFFGSQSGFMRTYPASVWNTHNEVDLFDVRRQSWYTQGSSSPKDMMILIDTSGSTHGQALQLMKNAVKSILDTLGENDFVNIVEFNQEADFVSDCFNHTAFVQANYRNKKQLEKDVEELKAQGQADYQVGLRFAFQKFQEFSQNSSDGDVNVGANCNKVIILLTDGGTDNAEEVFKEYNWPNKTGTMTFECNRAAAIQEKRNRRKWGPCRTPFHATSVDKIVPQELVFIPT
ncbi:voltage-dependent calcium channel subunit alpha-2/delta-2-like [Babylonia areolata]|uniref:voltage-dependent calcium channel subunit alpha-2/delta-2-like n=1 Tax=Babylonia areolata TaxID=304850 RepID=UPI003FD14DB7